MIEIDPNDTIQNMKIALSLVISNLDPSSIDIYHHNNKMKDDQIVYKVGINSGDSVEIKNKSKCCCVIY